MIAQIIIQDLKDIKSDLELLKNSISNIIYDAENLIDMDKHFMDWNKSTTKDVFRILLEIQHYINIQKLKSLKPLCANAIQNTYENIQNNKNQ